MGKYWITGRYWTFPLTAVELVSSSSTVPLNTLFLECSWLSCVSAELQSRVEVLNARFQAKRHLSVAGYWRCRTGPLYYSPCISLLAAHSFCGQKAGHRAKHLANQTVLPFNELILHCPATCAASASNLSTTCCTTRGAGHMLQGHQFVPHASNAYPIASPVHIQCIQ
eukprot:scaffold277310_cov19-Tisochrysis_lutea.AAC.1